MTPILLLKYVFAVVFGLFGGLFVVALAILITAFAIFLIVVVADWFDRRKRDEKAKK